MKYVVQTISWWFYFNQFSMQSDHFLITDWSAEIWYCGLLLLNPFTWPDWCGYDCTVIICPITTISRWVSVNPIMLANNVGYTCQIQLWIWTVKRYFQCFYNIDSPLTCLHPNANVLTPNVIIKMFSHSTNNSPNWFLNQSIHCYCW